MSARSSPGLRATLIPPLVRVASAAPPRATLALRPLIGAALRRAPGWPERVATAMRLALGDSAGDERHLRAYFAHLADLIAFSLVIYRHGIAAPALAGQWRLADDGVPRLRAALDDHGGALMVCPHLICHEIMAGVAGRHVPVTFLVRQSPEPRYEAVKQQWYASLGVRVAIRPGRAAGTSGLGALRPALRTVRHGGVLALTPDLLQGRKSGVPVRLFGRTARLPAGPFFIARHTGVPLVPSMFHHAEGRYELWARDSLPVDREGDRDVAIADAAQRWADFFEAHLREHPDMWQFWLDKRWSRWLSRAPRHAAGE